MARGGKRKSAKEEEESSASEYEPTDDEVEEESESSEEENESDEEPLASRAKKRGRSTPSGASSTSSKKGASPRESITTLSEEEVKKRLTKLAKQVGVKGAGKERAQLYKYLKYADGDVEAAAERYLDEHPGDAEAAPEDCGEEEEEEPATGKRKFSWKGKGAKKAGEKGEKGAKAKGGKGKDGKPRGGRVAPYVIPGARVAAGEPKYLGILDFVVRENVCRLHGEGDERGFLVKGAPAGLEAWRACAGESLVRLAGGPLEWLPRKAEDDGGPEEKARSLVALRCCVALESKGQIRTSALVGYHAPSASVVLRARVWLTAAAFEGHPTKVADPNLSALMDRVVFDPRRELEERAPGAPPAAEEEPAPAGKGKAKGKGKAAAAAAAAAEVAVEAAGTELELPARQPRPWAERWPEYHEWREGLSSQQEHDGDFSIQGILSRCLAPTEGVPLAGQPEGEITVPLRPYQLQSLRWMLDREASPTSLAVEMFWSELTLGDGTRAYYNPFAGNVKLQDVSAARGGILGEEMGLGKTVELLALIALNRPPASWLEGAPVRPGLTRSNATLVIAPVSLLEQWRLEIERKCVRPQKVYVYHTGRTSDVAKIAAHDIVLTTYSILQREAKGEDSPLEKIEWFRIICDESHYIKYAACAQAKMAIRLESPIRWLASGTPMQTHIMDLRSIFKYLRVYPFNVENGWNAVVKKNYDKHLKSGLQVTEHMVRSLVMRHVKAQVLGGKALVTLPPRRVETVAAEWRTEDERLLYERLFPVVRRKFLALAETDESLRAKYVDMVACVLALRQACSHPRSLPLVRFSGEQEAAGDPLGLPAVEGEAGRGAGAARPAPKSLSLEQILKGLSGADKGREYIRELERALREGTGGGGAIQCAICLDAIEAPCAVRPCLHLFCQECIAGLFAAGEKKAQCPSCRRPFTERQLVHIALREEAEPEAAAPGDEDEGEEQKQEQEQEQGDEEDEGEEGEGEGAPADASSPSSGAGRRRKQRGRGGKASPSAASGRAGRQPELLIPAVIPGDIGEDTVARYKRAVFEDGTKLSLLLEELDALWGRDAAAKVVVFTYFAHTFERVVEALTERGIKHSKLCGSMAQKSRARALRLFSEKPDVNVFVLSVRAGAVGLTLTAANWAFILEPCVNVGTEEQAINRIHRIGQTREVNVKILWLRGTVEERILQVRTRLKQAAPEEAEAPAGGELVPAGASGEGEGEGEECSSSAPLRPQGPGWGRFRAAGPAGALKEDRATDLRVAEWRDLFRPFEGPEALPGLEAAAPSASDAQALEAPPAAAAGAATPRRAGAEAEEEAAAAEAEPTVARGKRRGRGAASAAAEGAATGRKKKARAK
eukprot:tig00000711_g3431.t1